MSEAAPLTVEPLDFSNQAAQVEAQNEAAHAAQQQAAAQAERNKAYNMAFKDAYRAQGGTAAEYAAAFKEGTPGPKEQAAMAVAEQAVADHDWKTALAADNGPVLFARLDQVRPAEDAPQAAFQEFDHLLGQLTPGQRKEYLDSRWHAQALRAAELYAAEKGGKLLGDGEGATVVFPEKGAQPAEAKAATAPIDPTPQTEAPSAVFRGNAPEGWDADRWRVHIDFLDQLTANANHGQSYARQQLGIELERLRRADPAAYAAYYQQSNPNRFVAEVNRLAAGSSWENYVGEPLDTQAARQIFGERLRNQAVIMDEFGSLVRDELNNNRDPHDNRKLQDLYNRYPYLRNDMDELTRVLSAGSEFARPNTPANAAQAETPGVSELDDLFVLNTFQDAVIDVIKAGGGLGDNPEIQKLFDTHPHLQGRMNTLENQVFSHFRARRGEPKPPQATNPRKPQKGPGQGKSAKPEAKKEGENIWETLSPEEHQELRNRFNTRVRQIRAERKGRNFLSRAARAVGRSLFTGIRTPEEMAEQEVYGRYFEGQERAIDDKERENILKADSNYKYARYGDPSSRELTPQEQQARLKAEAWLRGTGFDINVQRSAYGRKYDVARVQQSVLSAVRSRPELGQQLRTRFPREEGESTRDYNLRLTQRLAQRMFEQYSDSLGARRPHTLRPGEAFRSFKRGRVASKVIAGTLPRSAKPARPGRPVHERSQDRFTALASSMPQGKREKTEAYVDRLLEAYNEQYGKRRRGISESWIGKEGRKKFEKFKQRLGLARQP